MLKSAGEVETESLRSFGFSASRGLACLLGRPRLLRCIFRMLLECSTVAIGDKGVQVEKITR